MPNRSKGRSGLNEVKDQMIFSFDMQQPVDGKRGLVPVRERERLGIGKRETRRLQGLFGRRHVLGADQQVNIVGQPRVAVDNHGQTAADGIGNPGGIQRIHGAQKLVPNIHACTLVF